MAHNGNFTAPQPQSQESNCSHPIQQANHPQNYNMQQQQVLPFLQPFPFQQLCYQPIYRLPQLLPPPPPLIRHAAVTRPPLIQESYQHAIPNIPPPPLHQINLQNNSVLSQNQACSQRVNVMNTAAVQSTSNSNQGSNAYEIVSQFLRPEQLYQLNLTRDQVPQLVITPVTLKITPSNMLPASFKNSVQTLDKGHSSTLSGTINATQTTNSVENNTINCDKSINAPETNVTLPVSNENEMITSENNVESVTNTQTDSVDTSTTTLEESPESNSELQKETDHGNEEMCDMTKTVSTFLKNNYNLSMNLSGWTVTESKMIDKDLIVRLFLLNDEGNKRTVKMTLQQVDDDNSHEVRTSTPETEAYEYQSALEDDTVNLSPIIPRKRGKTQEKTTFSKKDASTPKKPCDRFNYTKNLSPTRRSKRLWENTFYKMQNIFQNNNQIEVEEETYDNPGKTKSGIKSKEHNSGTNTQNILSTANLEKFNNQNYTKKESESLTERNMDIEKKPEIDISSCDTILFEPKRKNNNCILQKETTCTQKLEKVIRKEEASKHVSPDSTEKLNIPQSILKVQLPKYVGNKTGGLIKNVTFNVNSS